MDWVGMNTFATHSASLLSLQAPIVIVGVFLGYGPMDRRMGGTF